MPIICISVVAVADTAFDHVVCEKPLEETSKGSSGRAKEYFPRIITPCTDVRPIHHAARVQCLHVHHTVRRSSFRTDGSGGPCGEPRGIVFQRIATWEGRTSWLMTSCARSPERFRAPQPARRFLSALKMNQPMKLSTGDGKFIVECRRHREESFHRRRLFPRFPHARSAREILFDSQTIAKNATSVEGNPAAN